MLLDEKFADFLSSEIEKHVKLGMESVISKVKGMIDIAVDAQIKEIHEKTVETSDKLDSTISAIGDLKDHLKSSQISVDDVLKSVEPLINSAVDDAFSKLEMPEPKHYDLDVMKSVIADEVAKIPIPKDGVDGKDGISVSMDDIVSEMDKFADKHYNAVLEHATNLVSSMEKPKDGVDGKDGRDAPTADEVAEKMEGQFAKWALDFERKADFILQKSVDRMPAPKDGVDGKDGRDGMEIKDFDISLGDDSRSLTVSLKNGESVIEKSIKLPIPLYKGYWSDRSFEKGDMITHAGSLWMALSDTSDNPVTSESWKLVAKKGGTGKSAYDISRENGFKGTVVEWVESLGQKSVIKSDGSKK